MDDETDFIIGAVVIVIACLCCIGIGIFCCMTKRRNIKLNKVADNISYQTFENNKNDANASMKVQHLEYSLDNEAIDISANTLDDNENGNYKKSFKEVHQLDVKQWELRFDPMSKMPLLYNRIEKKNYWAWQHPQVAKTLGVNIPKKKIFRNSNMDDENVENKLIPPPPPPDAIPSNNNNNAKLVPPPPPPQQAGLPTDDDMNNTETIGLPTPQQNDDDYEYYDDDEQEYDNVDDNNVNNVGLPPPVLNPTDD